MSKTNYIKLMVNIFEENRSKWLSIINIIAQFYNMKDEDVERLPDKKKNNIKNDICKQFKTYIGHAREYFDENHGFLMAQPFAKGINKSELRYKLATNSEEDKKYINNELEKNDNFSIRSKERFGIRLKNVKEKKLLTDKEIESLLLKDDVKEKVNQLIK